MSESKLADLRVILLDPDPSKHHLEMIRSVLMLLDIVRIRDASDTMRLFDRLKHFEADVLIAAVSPSEAVTLAEAVRRHPDSPNPALPIVIVSTPMTPQQVSGLRDAGVTEMLVNPITVKALATRMESAALHPRPFVKSERFVGPDRRRRATTPPGPERRRNRPGTGPGGSRGATKPNPTRTP
jgi:two-component system chemotaxis response regulator CheY